MGSSHHLVFNHPLPLALSTRRLVCSARRRLDRVILDGHARVVCEKIEPKVILSFYPILLFLNLNSGEAERLGAGAFLRPSIEPLIDKAGEAWIMRNPVRGVERRQKTRFAATSGRFCSAAIKDFF